MATSDDLRAKLTEALVASPNAPWLTLPGPVDIAPTFVDALLPVVVEALASCHDAAVELTLDHAIRNDDGVTLRLDKPNPWRR